MSDKSREELEERVDKLEATVKKMLPSRRQVLKSGATAAGAGMLGFSAGNASAQASTEDGDGNVGDPDDRVDVFSDGVDANVVSTEVARTKTEPVANVKAFGAVGDGSADDTQAIQDAYATGSPVYFPPGDYRYTSALANNSSQIIGDGEANTTLIPDGVNGVQMSGESPILRDLTIADAGGNGVSIFNDCSGFVIENTTIENAASPPIFVEATESGGEVIEDGRIVGCRIDDPNFNNEFLIRLRTDWDNSVERQNVDYHVRDITVQNTHLSGGAKDGIEITGPGAHDNTVIGCTHEGFDGAAGAAFDAAFGAYDNDFIACTAKDSSPTDTNYSGFKDAGATEPSADRTNTGNKFIGCIVKDINASGGGDARAFKMTTAVDTVITSPTVARLDNPDSPTATIAFAVGQGEVGVSISDPDVSDVFYGIEGSLSTASDVRVSGGQFMDVGRGGWVQDNITIGLSNVSFDTTSSYCFNVENGRLRMSNVDMVDVNNDGVRLTDSDATLTNNHFINVSGTRIDDDTSSTVDEGTSFVS